MMLTQSFDRRQSISSVTALIQSSGQVIGPGKDALLGGGQSCSHMWGEPNYRSPTPVRGLQGSLTNEALGEFFQLWDEVQNVSLQAAADGIKWIALTAASAYDLFFMATEDCPYGELLWHSRAPSRVRFFMWIALKGRCLTADNLAKRNWPHDVLCPLCQREDEDCHHLFVSCDYTAAVWRKMRAWCNANFTIPADKNRSLAEWWLTERRRFRTSYRTDFDSAFMLICWVIWKERNARIFQNVSRTHESLEDDITEETAVWRVAGDFLPIWRVITFVAAEGYSLPSYSFISVFKLVSIF
ncbi:Os05g0326900 [Oryza sativa Japonica Group]|uniref:Os05g0326900 protein n=1 Tax=Oryza sativa subsp. japonica TaxID=39947 RepID=A0A0N7KKJ6_ORYSJ|nr:Os05g0326900 [Oryza sativa Japonica Group]